MRDDEIIDEEMTGEDVMDDRNITDQPCDDEPSPDSAELEHLGELEARCATREADWLASKETTKACKEEYDGSVSELRRAIRAWRTRQEKAASEVHPLFDGPNNARQASATPRPDSPPIPDRPSDDYVLNDDEPLFNPSDQQAVDAASKARFEARAGAALDGINDMLFADNVIANGEPDPLSGPIQSAIPRRRKGAKP